MQRIWCPIEEEDEINANVSGRDDDVTNNNQPTKKSTDSTIAAIGKLHLGQKWMNESNHNQNLKESERKIKPLFPLI